MSLFKRKNRDSETAANPGGKAIPCQKIVLICAGILGVALAVFLIITVLLPAVNYARAASMMRSGKHKEAYETYLALGNYKDSPQQAETALLRYRIDTIKTADVGSTIFFGRYEQDNDAANGHEEIEWIILERQGDKVLVISKNALDCKQYHPVSVDVTWQDSYIRQWLNSSFWNTAFSPEAQAIISLSAVSADRNPMHETDPGEATEDRLFLLSLTEVNQYFPTDDDRTCKPTAYAFVQGASSSAEGSCWWWMRSPGYAQCNAAIVNREGEVVYSGIYTFYGNSAVRPAMWIDLSSIS